jgi:BTB/POZ domain-containing protein KCTD9
MRAASAWPPRRPTSRAHWMAPVAWEEGSCEWGEYGFRKLAGCHVLADVGRLSLLLGVIFYCWGVLHRRKQAHYAAWQVINAAYGHRSNGGRIEALQDLNRDQVSLAGLAADHAYLVSINLPNASLGDASLQGANLFGATLQGADLSNADLQEADLGRATLQGADLGNANLQEAFLFGARLQGANLFGATLQGADLSNAVLQEANLGKATLQGANLAGADLRGAHHLTVAQIKAAQNWARAMYDEQFRAQLGLPPNPPHTGPAARTQTPRPYRLCAAARCFRTRANTACRLAFASITFWVFCHSSKCRYLLQGSW